MREFILWLITSLLVLSFAGIRGIVAQDNNAENGENSTQSPSEAVDVADSTNSTPSQSTDKSSNIADNESEGQENAAVASQTTTAPSIQSMDSSPVSQGAEPSTTESSPDNQTTSSEVSLKEAVNGEISETTTPSEVEESSSVSTTTESSENSTEFSEIVTTKPELIEVETTTSTTEDSQTTEGAEPDQTTSSESITTSEATTFTTETWDDEMSTTSPWTELTSTVITTSEQTFTDSQSNKADFVVQDFDGSPCLLASLNITTHFAYSVQESLVKEIYNTMSTHSQPEGAISSGTCGINTSLLSITWDNGTFTLNLTFDLVTKDVQTEEDVLQADILPEGNYTSVWRMSYMTLTYDTSNVNIFPGAASPKETTVFLGELNLFQTPLGQSYLCRTPSAVEVKFKDVTLAFNYVHLQAFGVTSDTFDSDNLICSGDIGSVPLQEERYLVPLIVACTLAAVVVIIILVYAISRQVNRHKRQSQYKQMP